MFTHLILWKSCECVLISTITYSKLIWFFRNFVKARARAMEKKSKAGKAGYRWSHYLEEWQECEHLNKRWPLCNMGQQNIYTLRSGSGVPRGQSCGKRAFEACLGEIVKACETWRRSLWVEGKWDLNTGTAQRKVRCYQQSCNANRTAKKLC